MESRKQNPSSFANPECFPPLLQLGHGTTKGVCGYDLGSLMDGSLGSLGIVTEATLRLRPAADRVGTLAVFLISEVDLGRVIGAALTHHLQPRRWKKLGPAQRPRPRSGPSDSPPQLAPLSVLRRPRDLNSLLISRVFISSTP